MQELTRLALVGTANQPSDAVSVAEIDTLVPTASREQRILLQAAGLAVYQQAGRLPGSASPPVPAPLEPPVAISPALQGVLSAAIRGELVDLAPWLGARMARLGLRLPPTLLPLVFSKPATLGDWHAVIGERGRWLAAQHRDWQAQLDKLVVTELDRAILLRDWEEGSTAQRCRALAQLRRQDPAQARDWLGAVLAKEKAEQRQALVAVLAEGLSKADEPLLEGLLDDRSQAVRREVANLLAQLPDSAYMERMRVRARACVQWQAAAAPVGLLARVGAALGKKAVPTLRVELPQELPKDWERDGIAANPDAGWGKRAYWLRELVATVPPPLWVEWAGADIEQLLPAMQADEWSEALLAGCAKACGRYRNAGWGLPLLEHALNSQSGALLVGLPDLWRVIDAPTRDAKLGQLLANGQENHAWQCMQQLPAPWSSALVSAVCNAALADAAIERKPEAYYRHPDFSLYVEQALLCATDADLPKLAPVLALYGQWVAEGREAHPQRYNRARLVTVLAEAKLTAIKEMPL